MHYLAMFLYIVRPDKVVTLLAIQRRVFGWVILDGLEELKCERGHRWIGLAVWQDHFLW